MTESIPNPVPTTDNPDAWRKFIDNELPLIETTADERELRRARKVLLTEAMHGDTELLQNHCTLGTESLQHALLDDSAVVVMCGPLITANSARNSTYETASTMAI